MKWAFIPIGSNFAHDERNKVRAAYKEYCGLWGHTGWPLADILSWLQLTYGLDPEICREALILGANKRGLWFPSNRSGRS
jgi:hypothetical protein